jgi:hypothetical protein
VPPEHQFSVESPFELTFVDFVDFGRAESDKRGLGADHNLVPQLVIVCAALVIVWAALVQRVCQQGLAQLRHDLPKILQSQCPSISVFTRKNSLHFEHRNLLARKVPKP